MKVMDIDSGSGQKEKLGLKPKSFWIDVGMVNV